MTYRKKLIEVALPLEEINIASAREKSIRHGHPSTLHLWWARRPLAACRAVIFSQIVDDPGEEGAPAAYLKRIDELPLGPQYKHQALEPPLDPEGKPLLGEAAEKEMLARTRRFKLFTLIEDLVQWENTTNDDVLNRARDLIRLACIPSPPPQTEDYHEILKWAFEQVGDSNAGYERFGSVEELGKLVESMKSEWARSRKISAPLESIRGALFFLQRADRHAGGAGEPSPEMAQFAQALYDQARAQWSEAQPEVPPLHDPFAGGGSIPLEAQRLGLEAYASDLNPVAVVINKAMIEIPPKFAGMPPVNPEARAREGMTTWKGAQGLAEDVRYYGKWMRDEAEKRIGHLYPRVKVTADMVAERPDLRQYLNRELTVIAWLWARTVKSPNPAFRDIDVPLASTFMLSTKVGKEAYVVPVIEGGGYRFLVKVGKPSDALAAKNGTKLARGANFKCLMSNVAIDGDYIKSEGRAGRMGAKLMAIVLEGDRGRVYISPTQDQETIARSACPTWKPESSLPDDPRNFWTVQYGLSSYGDLFTDRQLVALTTLSDLVAEAREQARKDALVAGRADDHTLLRDGGTGALANGEAVGLYLSFALAKQADLGNSLCRWEPIAQCPRQLFGRQAIPMVWDYAEGNVLGSSSGAWIVFIEGITKSFSKSFENVSSGSIGHALQADAGLQTTSVGKVVSTDPPYYDNIGYADLSDFFYTWHRRTVSGTFPELFATLAVPKTEELVATPYRHGGKEAAEDFFLDGMTSAMQRLAQQVHQAYPISIYYAFKQSESIEGVGESSTGWETFLEAVTTAGLQILGTWPLRTENESRMVGQGTNALASSIVLVCGRKQNFKPITRRDFQAELREALPAALKKLTQGNIAPVDLAQAAIGPGMAVFTKYERVIEASGEEMSVRTALQIINEVLEEVFERQEGWYDPETRFAVTWFTQNGFQEGKYDDAAILSRARGTAPNAMEEFGFIKMGGGNFKLLSRSELAVNYDPASDRRTAIWEATQYLCRALDQGGEDEAAKLMRRFRDTKPDLDIDRARELAYRLYSICQKRQPAEARVYDALVRSWSDITIKSELDSAMWTGDSGQSGLGL